MRDLSIRAISVRAIIAPNLESTVLRVDTLFIHYINLRVILVESFRYCFKLLMGVIFVSIITLVRVAANL